MASIAPEIVGEGLEMILRGRDVDVDGGNYRRRGEKAAPVGVPTPEMAQDENEGSDKNDTYKMGVSILSVLCKLQALAI